MSGMSDSFCLALVVRGEQKSFFSSLRKVLFVVTRLAQLFLPLVYTDPCWRTVSINTATDFCCSIGCLGRLLDNPSKLWLCVKSLD